MATTDMTIQHTLASDALNTAIDAARIADPLIAGEHGAHFIALRKDFALVEVPNKFGLPPMIVEHPTVDESQSLIDYTNRFRTDRTILRADYPTGRITAALNYHGHNQDADPLAPAFDTHFCTLALLASEEFSRWNAFEMAMPKTGGMHSQAEFAAFLEENANDVIQPEPSVLIEISRDLEAVQDVQFEGRTRLESGDRTFYYATETKTKGELKVPREFTLNIPLYNGEPAIDIKCALRFRVSAGGLQLGFEWRRVEYQRRAHFNLIANTVAEATGCPVFFGR